MALISLIHPSRGRPKKSFQNSTEWIENAGCDIDLVVSVDFSDQTAREYNDVYFGYKNVNLYSSQVMYSDNGSVVDATNRAAANSIGDILLYLSDDFKCFPGWGIEIEKQFEGVTEPMLLKVDDCLQPFNVAVLTIPIMNRALYNRLGYFWHPDYKSMWVDCDLYETAKKLNSIKFCKHLKFPHEHHSLGKCENDDTYKRSENNWKQGLEIFNRRKKLNFPL